MGPVTSLLIQTIALHLQTFMKNKLLPWLILITLSLVWGSSFILMKRGMDAFPDNQVAALRISIAFISLLPLVFKHAQVSVRKFLPGLLLMGFFGNLIPAFLFTAAETRISSSLAGMLNALTPLFTVLVGFVWLKNKVKTKQLIGILIGFLAAAALMIFDASEDPFRNLTFGLLVVLATFCYAISVNSIKHYLGGLGPVQATAGAFCFTGPPALLYLFGFTDFTERLQYHPLAWQSLGYVSILAVVGTALSVILYNILIRSAGVLFASSCTYLIPVVAVMWGMGDGEQVNGLQLISIGIIILSVYLINRD